MLSPFTLLYPDLVEARKSCRRCVIRDPGKIHAGAEYDYDPDVVSYWSQWLGHPYPYILVIGQDFGDIDYFNKYKGADSIKNETNDFLYKLLWHAGLKPGRPPNEDSQTRVYLTNSVLCLKQPPMNSPLRAPWIRACSESHLRPLIARLKPPIVVAMGKGGWQAARDEFAIEDSPQKITIAAGNTWTTKSGMLIFPVGHCGRLGQGNRPWAKQLEDWSKIGNALHLLTNFTA